MIPKIDLFDYIAIKKIKFGEIFNLNFYMSPTFQGNSCIGKDNKKSATPSLTLMAKTDIQRTLVAQDLKPFIQETLFDK